MLLIWNGLNSWRSCVDKIENYMKNGYTKDNERERDSDKTTSREITEERKMI